MRRSSAVVGANPCTTTGSPPWSAADRNIGSSRSAGPGAGVNSPIPHSPRPTTSLATAAGLPTRVVAALLPCTADSGTGPALAPCPGVPEALRNRLAELDDRAARLATERA
ncbi:hypothetical protein ACWDBD_13950 [Streptomyces sp. NPDC001118]